MRYFLDTEFYDTGGHIRPISIGLVSEDSRELYLQFDATDFKNTTDWLARNVYPQLGHFNMANFERSCSPRTMLGTDSSNYDGACALDCPWRTWMGLRNSITSFIFADGDIKAEIWGWYASYDWVVFSQIWGKMLNLPSEYKKFIYDLKPIAELHGITFPTIHDKHHALSDARWIRESFLQLKSELSHLDSFKD